MLRNTVFLSIFLLIVARNASGQVVVDQSFDPPGPTGAFESIRSDLIFLHYWKSGIEGTLEDLSIVIGVGFGSIATPDIEVEIYRIDGFGNVRRLEGSFTVDGSSISSAFDPQLAVIDTSSAMISTTPGAEFLAAFRVSGDGSYELRAERPGTFSDAASASSGQVGGESDLQRFNRFAELFATSGSTFSDIGFRTRVRIAPVLGDFDMDGDVDLEDLDRYNGNIGIPAVGEQKVLDLNENDFVDAGDFSQHYSNLVETSNGQTGTFAGDVDLDGTVDVLGDAFALVGSLNMFATSWSQGDLDGDGVVDVLGDAFLLIGNLGNTNEPVQDF